MAESRSNIERMRTFVEQVQGQGRADLVEEFVHADFRNHTASPGQSPGRDGVRVATEALHAAFSDFQVELLHCIGADDVVSTHKVFRGRHTGEWFGVPASGRPVEFAIMDITRYRDGLMVEHWAVADALTLLHQTGALG
ncbi:ester cyclase [Frankia sp. AvcI1]|uniref:ester cyclase n=1 Tax=Frankia sp. AvcI1 TaxID=573496 RepID=UPI0021180EC6|nr:ester cyclase [Frankia sp. AvcI1]